MRDLWDILHVYVAPSGIPGAGEGLYARTDIQPGIDCHVVAVASAPATTQVKLNLVGPPWPHAPNGGGGEKFNFTVRRAIFLEN